MKLRRKQALQTRVTRALLRKPVTNVTTTQSGRKAASSSSSTTKTDSSTPEPTTELKEQTGVSGQKESKLSKNSSKSMKKSGNLKDSVNVIATTTVKSLIKKKISQARNKLVKHEVGSASDLDEHRKLSNADRRVKRKNGMIPSVRPEKLLYTPTVVLDNIDNSDETTVQKSISNATVNTVDSFAPNMKSIKQKGKSFKELFRTYSKEQVSGTHDGTVDVRSKHLSRSKRPKSTNLQGRSRVDSTSRSSSRISSSTELATSSSSLASRGSSSSSVRDPSPRKLRPARSRTNRLSSTFSDDSEDESEPEVIHKYRTSSRQFGCHSGLRGNGTSSRYSFRPAQDSDDSEQDESASSASSNDRENSKRSSTTNITKSNDADHSDENSSGSKSTISTIMKDSNVKRSVTKPRLKKRNVSQGQNISVAMKLQQNQKQKIKLALASKPTSVSIDRTFPPVILSSREEPGPSIVSSAVAGNDYSDLENVPLQARLKVNTAGKQSEKSSDNYESKSCVHSKNDFSALENVTVKTRIKTQKSLLKKNIKVRRRSALLASELSKKVLNDELDFFLDRPAASKLENNTIIDESVIKLASVSDRPKQPTIEVKAGANPRGYKRKSEEISFPIASEKLEQVAVQDSAEILLTLPPKKPKMQTSLRKSLSASPTMKLAPDIGLSDVYHVPLNSSDIIKEEPNLLQDSATSSPTTGTMSEIKRTIGRRKSAPESLGSSVAMKASVVCFSEESVANGEETTADEGQKINRKRSMSMNDAPEIGGKRQKVIFNSPTVSAIIESIVSPSTKPDVDTSSEVATSKRVRKSAANRSLLQSKKNLHRKKDQNVKPTDLKNFVSIVSNNSDEKSKLSSITVNSSTKPIAKVQGKFRLRKKAPSIAEYRCRECGLLFDSLTSYNSHDREVCANIVYGMCLITEDQLFECPHCSLTFAYKSTQKKHSSSCRASKGRRSNCRPSNRGVQPVVSNRILRETCPSTLHNSENESKVVNVITETITENKLTADSMCLSKDELTQEKVTELDVTVSPVAKQNNQRKTSKLNLKSKESPIISPNKCKIGIIEVADISLKTKTESAEDDSLSDISIAKTSTNSTNDSMSSAKRRPRKISYKSTVVDSLEKSESEISNPETLISFIKSMTVGRSHGKESCSPKNSRTKKTSNAKVAEMKRKRNKARTVQNRKLAAKLVGEKRKKLRTSLEKSRPESKETQKSLTSTDDNNTSSLSNFIKSRFRPILPNNANNKPKIVSVPSEKVISYVAVSLNVVNANDNLVETIDIVPAPSTSSLPVSTIAPLALPSPFNNATSQLGTKISLPVLALNAEFTSTLVNLGNILQDKCTNQPVILEMTAFMLQYRLSPNQMRDILIGAVSSLAETNKSPENSNATTANVTSSLSVVSSDKNVNSSISGCDENRACPEASSSAEPIKPLVVRLPYQPLHPPTEENFPGAGAPSWCALLQELVNQQCLVQLHALLIKTARRQKDQEKLVGSDNALTRCLTLHWLREEMIKAVSAIEDIIKQIGNLKAEMIRHQMLVTMKKTFEASTL